MYKFNDNQVSFADFGQPVGMKMSAENRWVKKAECIPWGEIEYRYAKLFTNKKGNVAKPLRLALGACIIQAEYRFSDVETALMIQERLETLRVVFRQQQQMYQTGTHAIGNRIVSISRPYLRPIVRGKAKSPVEFGAKLDISVEDGYTRLETFSFEAYNEATFLKTIIERYCQRTGRYPQRVLADKIYRNRENLRFCKEHGIRLSGSALGRPKKDVVVDKQQDYADICERVEVERRISLAKRKCGLGLLTTRLEETTASAIALSIVVLNLRKIQCVFFYWLRFCLSACLLFRSPRKLAFVQ